jgi:hypothetical protein
MCILISDSRVAKEAISFATRLFFRGNIRGLALQGEID